MSISIMDAKFLGIMWAVESMVSHHVHKIIFETEALELVRAVLRPKAWPAYRYQESELRKSLVKINDWSLGGVCQPE